MRLLKLGVERGRRTAVTVARTGTRPTDQGGSQVPTGMVRTARRPKTVTARVSLSQRSSGTCHRLAARSSHQPRRSAAHAPPQEHRRHHGVIFRAVDHTAAAAQTAAVMLATSSAEVRYGGMV